MHAFINNPLQIGSLTIPNRLLQGPLAGYSCAPFRTLFNHYTPPAYCVSEMCSAADIIQNKHKANSRYLYRAPQEPILAYQISGTEPLVLAQAARQLQMHGADLIDINCGCPKPKIRKKGAGSALLENPELLIRIIREVRAAISIPLTIKIRIQGNDNDLVVARKIEEAGADALIVHGRRWQDDYDVAADWLKIAKIKQVLTIPVIANGDIAHRESLQKAVALSKADAYMIARAGSGHPWLYQDLLGGHTVPVSYTEKIDLFMAHLHGLASLEDEYKAVLQSKSLVRYYFGKLFNAPTLNHFYQLNSLAMLEQFLRQNRLEII